MKPDLEDQLKELARQPILLVASDYDGTIAPIVSDPEKAKPHREALVALKSLAKLPHTHVAIISGRALSNLAQLLGNANEFHLVGSHGSEFEPGYASQLPKEVIDLRDQLVRDLRKLVGNKKGLFVEEKPAGVSLHYRNASTVDAAELIHATIEHLASRRGVYLRHGKKVIELSVVATHKGIALENIRHRVGASAVLFLGDDKTDEDAFSTLKGPDVGIKVGEGESLAPFRIDSTEEVARLLARLVELRAQWLEGSQPEPIESHAMLSDQRTIALLNPYGRINWFCVPRIDSGAIFAEILGGPTAGYFSIEAMGDSTEPKQKYRSGTMSVETSWKNIQVVDYLDCSGGRMNQRAGRTDLIRVIDGKGKVRIEFAPRLDFGRTATRILVREDGLEIEDTVDPIVLRSPGVKWQIQSEGFHHTAIAEVQLKASQPLVLELRYGTGSLNQSWLPEEKRRFQTETYWKKWTDSLQIPKFPRKVREAVIRSALTLKALCYGPSGAIAAAGTTSLPEHIGGVRNWDYRFCWLRDAALSAQALVELGSISEAMNFLDWVLDIVDKVEQPDRLRPLYTVTGASVMGEAEISELSGYAGSRPVRVGNAAANQIQLDVFGPVVELAWQLSGRGAPLSADHWRLVQAMVTAVERRWKEPDHGIWEIRAPRRHHTHSKVMCWVTIDRAIKLSELFLGRTNESWKRLRAEIESDILENAWNQIRETFTTAYQSIDLDAAALFVGLSGLLDRKDKRFASTVKAIEKELLEGDVVYRYLGDDGLPGGEGGFHLCTCWLIESYILVGRKKEALNLFNSYLSMAGKTGLFSEEYGMQIQQGLGNHPQAYSHLGLIQAAMRLWEAGAFKK